ncbi:MAG: hypothetical protein ACLQVL_18540 [Terriglobia bacterium]
MSCRPRAIFWNGGVANVPQFTESLKLSSTLQQLQSGVLKVFTAKTPQLDRSKIVPMYSKGVLTNEKLASDPVLVGFGQQVTSQLNNAKTLMNQLGYKDVTQAPAISVSLASVKVVPGQLKASTDLVLRPPILEAKAVDAAAVLAKPADVAAKPDAIVARPSVVDPAAPRPSPLPPGGGAPGFSPVSWLVNEAVIIASSLDLTHTNLIIDPSVSKLTIIVETLTCDAGAQITCDDSAVWNPSPLPQTTAQAGSSYNQSHHPDGQDNGSNGGDGTAGQTGSPQTVAPPAAPSISIYALNITGMPAISVQGLKGAQGNPGQNGGSGGNGAKEINGSDIPLFGVGVCRKTPGNGGNGGNAGQGGAGGSFFIATTDSNWQSLLNQSWQIANTGGPGENPGLPGSGGAGGGGGYPGDPSPGGAGSKASGGGNGAAGVSGTAGGVGPVGTGGVITPTIITAAEWEDELTLP